MNPLQRARDSARRAWGKSTRGTARTAHWVRDGVADAFGRAGDRLRGLVSREGGADSEASAKAGAEKRSAADAGPGLAERLGLSALARRAREDRRVAIAEICLGILIVAWIGWTVYIWGENGSTAGLGVLISWPAVLLALAIVASPFVAAAMLVKRHRLEAAGAPGIDAGPEAEPEAKSKPKAKPAAKAEAKDDEADEDEAEAEDDEDGSEPKTEEKPAAGEDEDEEEDEAA